MTGETKYRESDELKRVAEKERTAASDAHQARAKRLAAVRAEKTARQKRAMGIAMLLLALNWSIPHGQPVGEDNYFLAA